MLPMFAMVILFVFFWVFFVQQSQGRREPCNLGKSKALYNDDSAKGAVHDVAGADEEKEELEEIVEFQRNQRNMWN